MCRNHPLEVLAQTESFTIGIAFTWIGSSSSPSIGGAGGNDMAHMNIKHWQLVIKYNSSPGRYRLMDGYCNAEGNFDVTDEASDIPAFDYVFTSLLRYQGYGRDFTDTLSRHPMIASRYSETFNNCQHFVADFVLLLQAFASSGVKPARVFDVINTSLWQNVMKVLEFRGNGTVFHRSNLMLKLRYFVPATGAATSIGLATLTTEVPATGLAAWFSGPAVVAAYPMAASMIPVTAAATVLSGGYYWWLSSYWDRQTTFPNPRIHGFPS